MILMVAINSTYNLLKSDSLTPNDTSFTDNRYEWSPPTSFCLFTWEATYDPSVSTEIVVSQSSYQHITGDLTAQEYAAYNGITLNEWYHIAASGTGVEKWQYCSTINSATDSCSGKWPSNPSTTGLEVGHSYRIANFMIVAPDIYGGATLYSHRVQYQLDTVNKIAKLSDAQLNGDLTPQVCFSRIVEGPLMSEAQEVRDAFFTAYQAANTPAGLFEGGTTGVGVGHGEIQDAYHIYNVSLIVGEYDDGWCEHIHERCFNHYVLKSEFAGLATTPFMPRNGTNTSFVRNPGWVGQHQGSFYNGNVTMEFSSYSNALYFMEYRRFVEFPSLDWSFASHMYPMELRMEDLKPNPSYKWVKHDYIMNDGGQSGYTQRQTAIMCYPPSRTIDYTTPACYLNISEDYGRMCNNGTWEAPQLQMSIINGSREDKTLYYTGTINGFLDHIGANVTLNVSSGCRMWSNGTMRAVSSNNNIGDTSGIIGEACFYPIASNGSDFEFNPNDLYNATLSSFECSNVNTYVNTYCYDQDYNTLECPST